MNWLLLMSNQVICPVAANMPHLFDTRVYIIVVIFASSMGFKWDISPSTINACEGESKDLNWSYTVDVDDKIKALSWYKGTSTRIASWSERSSFKVDISFGQRLELIGDSVLKFKNLTQSDSDIYWLVVTMASEDQGPEKHIQLHVYAAPTRSCQPVYKASSQAWILPSGCDGLNVICTNDTTSTTEECCAKGPMQYCYKRDDVDLCVTYHAKLNHTEGSGNVDIIIGISVGATVPIMIILLTVSFVIYRRRQGRNLGSIRGQKGEEETVTIELLKKKNAKQNIPTYLRSQYMDRTNVYRFIAGKEHLNDVSDVFVDIYMTKQQQNKIDENYQVYSYEEMFRKGKGENDSFHVVVIEGYSGYGKTTWCKRLVSLWCYIAEIGSDTALEKGTFQENIGFLQNIKLLMYITPKDITGKVVNINGLLYKQVFTKKKFNADQLLPYIQENPESVLLLVDGLDVVNEDICSTILELIRKTISYKGKCFITTRPGEVDVLHRELFKNWHEITFFKIKGMCATDAKTFCENSCKLVYGNTDEAITSKLYEVWNYCVSNDFSTFMCAPFLVLQLVNIWVENNMSFPIQPVEILLQLASRQIERELVQIDNKTIVIANIQETNFSSPDYFTRQHYLPEVVFIFYIMSNKAYSMSVTPARKEVSAMCALKSVPNDASVIEQICLNTGIITKPWYYSEQSSAATVSFVERKMLELFLALHFLFNVDDLYNFATSQQHACDAICTTFSYAADFFSQEIEGYNSDRKTSFSINNSTYRSTELDQNKKQNYISTIASESTADICKSLERVIISPSFNNHSFLFVTSGLLFIHSLTHLEIKIVNNMKGAKMNLKNIPSLKNLNLDIKGCEIILSEELTMSSEHVHNYKHLERLSLSNVFIDTFNISLFPGVWQLLLCNIQINQLQTDVSLTKNRLFNVTLSKVRPCNVLHDIVLHISTASSIHQFAFKNCDFGNQVIDFSWMKSLRNLQIVRMEDSVMTEVSWKSFYQNLSEIEYLYTLFLVGTCCPEVVSKYILKWICKCSKLTYLDLNKIRLRGTEQIQITNKFSLEKVHVSSLEIDDNSCAALVDIIRNSSSLKELHICDVDFKNYVFDFSCLSAMRKYCEINISKVVFSKDSTRTLDILGRTVSQIKKGKINISNTNFENNGKQFLQQICTCGKNVSIQLKSTDLEQYKCDINIPVNIQFISNGAESMSKIHEQGGLCLVDKNV